MIHAYPEFYLSKAMRHLGDAFDFAINECGISGTVFSRMFINSKISRCMENGEAKYLVGMSGIDIALECIEDTTGKAPEIIPREVFSRTPEYWCGWAICYYQWYSSRTFADIFRIIPFEDLMQLYPTLHEAGEEKLAATMDEIIRRREPETNLKRYRTILNCTQQELSDRSGVSLRSIQMYEQRNKDINKAAGDTLWNLSRVLGCSMEALLER